MPAQAGRTAGRCPVEMPPNDRNSCGPAPRGGGTTTTGSAGRGRDRGPVPVRRNRPAGPHKKLHSSGRPAPSLGEGGVWRCDGTSRPVAGLPVQTSGDARPTIPLHRNLEGGDQPSPVAYTRYRGIRWASNARYVYRAMRRDFVLRRHRVRSGKGRTVTRSALRRSDREPERRSGFSPGPLVGLPPRC